MQTNTRIDFDELMSVLTVIGFVALATWVVSAVVGVLSGYTLIAPSPTLRFLLAVLIVSFSRRTYWELREWRWSKLPPDERSGFFNPLDDHAMSLGMAPEDAGGTGDGFEPATGPSQARA
jgi:hypothetical protein